MSLTGTIDNFVHLWGFGFSLEGEAYTTTDLGETLAAHISPIGIPREGEFYRAEAVLCYPNGARVNSQKYIGTSRSGPVSLDPPVNSRFQITFQFDNLPDNGGKQEIMITCPGTFMFIITIKRRYGRDNRNQEDAALIKTDTITIREPTPTSTANGTNGYH